MSDLRQLQIMQKVIQVLIEKISCYTSKGFAANLVCKAIMTLRDDNNCFNFIIVNEMRYEEGANAFTVSEDFNYVNSHEFYSSLKNLIEKIMECFDENIDIHFVNDLRNEIPDIFYAIDNLDDIKNNDTKQQIMIVDDNLDLIETVKKGLHRISDEYEITGANSGVECFDILSSGYTPKLILLDIMMSGDKGLDIFNRLKRSSNWNDIPVVLLGANDDSFKNDFIEFSVQGYITKPFEIIDLKKRIDKVLNRTKNDHIYE